MRSLVARILIVLIGVFVLVQALHIFIGFAAAILYSPKSTGRISVEHEAIQLAQEALKSVKVAPVAQSVGYWAEFINCKKFLRERLEFNENQYTLTVTAAFDPNDPRFSSAGVMYANGSRDAEVMVQFPDGTEVKLYFYAAWWEGCTVVKSFQDFALDKD